MGVSSSEIRETPSKLQATDRGIHGNQKTLSFHGNFRRFKSNSATQTGLFHEGIGGFVCFADPFLDFVGFGGVLELERNGPVDVQFFNLSQVGFEVNNTASGRQIAVYFTVAVRNVDMDGLALQLLQLGWFDASEQEMRDINIGLERGMIDFIDEADHGIDVVEQREGKRFEFQGDFQPQVGCVFGEPATILHRGLPLFCGGNDFAVPDVFPEDQQEVTGLVLVTEIEVILDPLEMEPLHAGIEINQADRDTADGHDGQVELVTGILDQSPLADVDILRIDKDIHAVKADLFRFVQSPGGITTGLSPGGVDHPQFHRGSFAAAVPGVVFRFLQDNSPLAGRKGIDQNGRNSYWTHLTSLQDQQLMDLKLQNAPIIITGGASGIGLATARTFAEEGALPVLWDQSDQVTAVAEQLASETGQMVHGFQVDITDFEALQDVTRQTVAEVKSFAHLVHAAAIGSGKFGFPFTNLTPADWPRVFEVNMQGMVNVAHAVTPVMQESDAGSMVFVSSIAGQIGSQTDPPYSASKAANINFAQCLAKDLAAGGIRVNSVCPGMVQTPLNQSVWQAWNDRQPEDQKRSYEDWAGDKIRQLVPLQRWQTTQDIADMIVFLSSARAAQVTGQTINVDGGFVMHW